MESIGTCPICLTEITAVDEAFVEPCLHHFCFQCIQLWVKTQQNQSNCITCPVCKIPFVSVIYDCHDVAYRIWRTDGTTTADKHLSNGFGLTPEQRRRRSRYIISVIQDKDDQGRNFLSIFEGKLITLAGLSRPATTQWLRRELQALLLQKDVDLLAQHIIGNLKHGIEASAAENKRLRKPGPGRLKGDAAVDVVASAMLPYLPEHAKRLGQEFIGFLLSGLNVDAHDALVFCIPEPEEVDVEFVINNYAMVLKRSKLVCLLSLLSFLIIESNGRKGTFENKLGNDAAIPLLPGIPLLSQRISIDDELIRYRPQGLQPSKGYEVRISAPATIPASIHLWLEPVNSPLNIKRRHSRKLLNAEKIIFRTGEHGGVLYQGKEYPSMNVVFQAEKGAISRDGLGKGSQVLLFDIILEENVLGIPISALPLVLTAVVAVALCVGVLPWWAGTAAPELVRWLIAGTKERRKTRMRK